MGLFNFFKKKKSESGNSANSFLDEIVAKYFNGSNPKLLADAKVLLELTKLNLTENEMLALLLRGLGTLELKGDWNADTATAMRNECSGKLTDTDLKWLLVYCDLHYVHKNPEQEALLLFELAGRQMGMPSPHGEISKNYVFH
jgi:hypothetical protein